VNYTWNGPQWKKRVKEVGLKGVIECGLAIEAQAKLLAPVDKGRLRDSITTQWQTGGSSPGATAQAEDVISKPSSGAAVGTNVDYAEYQEYGTTRSAAQPYMRPAIDIVSGRAVRIVQNAGRGEFDDY
jgi:HK97 gp10 family phage protein